MDRKPLKPKRRRRTPPGTSPGTLIADPDALQSTVSVVGYGSDQFVEKRGVGIEEIKSLKGTVPNIWVNVNGLADIEFIKQLGETFGLHNLALEDVINVHQRPKAEEYDNHIYIVARIIEPDVKLMTEQVSIFVGNGFIITLLERPCLCFQPVIERLNTQKGRIRKSGTDYLAYALIDSIIDAYFPVLEEYGERLEDLEGQVVRHPSPELIEKVHGMKRDLLLLRRAIWPHREMINELIRDETRFAKDHMQVYMRDCYDHIIQLMDIIETYREIASGLVDVYLSSMSTRLNDIMKVLTIIATIFMPLSFIASLYGMNFDRTLSPWNMPELSWYFGYPFALGIMAISAGLLLYYFIRQRWITFGRRK